MQDHFAHNLAPLRIGILFALLTLCYGFALGAAFGAAEDVIKGRLSAGGQSYLSQLDTATAAAQKGKVEATIKKSWSYMKRAHLHANGLGTAALSLILLLSLLTAGETTKRLVAAALGVGALGYSMFWMFAGLRAPGLGSTHAAKESLEWFAIPSSALCLLGLAAVLVLFTRTAFLRSSDA